VLFFFARLKVRLVFLAYYRIKIGVYFNPLLD